MIAFGKASLHEVLAIPLPCLFLMAALPHLPLAHENLFPEKPRSMAPNSNIKSFN